MPNTVPGPQYVLNKHTFNNRMNESTEDYVFISRQRDKMIQFVGFFFLRSKQSFEFQRKLLGLICVETVYLTHENIVTNTVL